MKTKINSLLFFLLFFPLCLMAQNTVKGTVTEQSSSLPLPSVNVIIKDTAKGTATDFDGNYEVNVNNGDVLVFSYIGFINQEIVYNGQQTINISLVEDASSLDEVFVIGYGTAKKDDLTGSVELITTKDFNKGPIVSAQQLISGKVAGVNITSGGGAPGEGQSIRIRGTSSISLTNEPLIVVDNVPLDGSGVIGSRNILNSINPNDIESMTVLKDASAAAIFGSRAANGVIMITTKKGKNSGFKFNFNTATTLHSAVDQVDLLSASQFRNVVNSTNDTAAISRLGTANTNWQDEIYSSAFGQDHNLSALGSAFGVPMRASVGFSNHDGILMSDNFKRTTGSLNFTPKFLDDHLTIQLNARGSYTENTFADRGAIGSAISFDPTQSVFDSGSQYAGYFAWIDSGTGNQLNLAPTNPVALLNLIDDTAEVRHFIGNAKIDYNLQFFTDLTATVNLGLETTNSHGRRITSEFIPTSDDTFNGSRTNYTSRNTNKLLDTYLTYNKSINSLHNIKMVAGYSYQDMKPDSYNFDSELQEDGNSDFERIDIEKEVILSYFGRLNYDFNDKYLVTASFRADASSKLNPDDRWGYFPSIGAAWNIHNEKFMDNSFMNELRFRIGYGEIGNINDLDPYQFLTRYTGSQATANYQFGNAFFQTYRPEPINENLRWEVVNTFNIGLDYGLWNNRISGSFNAYIKKTTDLIARASIDPFTNFGNRVDKNIGDMENKGIEFALNLIPVQNDNIKWSINYNIAVNDNTITNLPFDESIGGISGGVGNNVQLHTEGEAPFSYYVFQQVYDTAGKPIEGAYVDRNGDNIINDDDKYIYKDPNADIVMGLNTNFSYKKWDFSMQNRANIGNYVYDNVASSNAYLRRATDNNILTNLHADYLDTGFQNTTEGNLLSSHYVKEASFFKIDNITLGYTLDNAIKNTTLRFYGSLQNVATFTKYEGLDPEINGGIDNNFYPRPRSFVLGVNVDF